MYLFFKMTKVGEYIKPDASAATERIEKGKMLNTVHQLKNAWTELSSISI